MQNPLNVCLSYSSNKKYLKYLERGLFTLNKNSPNCHASVDLINCYTSRVYNNVVISNTEINTNGKPPVRKCFKPQHLKEHVVPFSGAYANLKKVYNIYDILNLNKFDLVLNMDADNLIQKDILSFEGLYDNDYDILIRFRDEPLFGDELLSRKENFKTFDLSKINLELEDRRFREGCFIVKNNKITKAFFKFIKDNILEKIEWYADSYWFLRAFQKFKNDIIIKKLPSNFVAYNLETELDGAYIASGYGVNKYSPIYKKLLSLYD
jgi:hypothetical protein